MKISEGRSVKHAWAEAVVEGDVEAVMALYSATAVLNPTLSPYIRQGKAQIRPYFEGGGEYDDAGFLKQGIVKVDFIENRWQDLGEAGVLIGKYKFTRSSGEPVSADYTFVFRKDERGVVRIVVHHSSLPFAG